jgi:hypothetical protein
MTRNFCDLCGRETTDARRLQMEIDDYPGASTGPMRDPRLGGRLHTYEVCETCALRALTPPEKVSR